MCDDVMNYRHVDGTVNPKRHQILDAAFHQIKINIVIRLTCAYGPEKRSHPNIAARHGLITLTVDEGSEGEIQNTF